MNDLLWTEVNKPQVRDEIKRTWDDDPPQELDNLNFVYEHGQWWVTGLNDEDEIITYSVVDIGDEIGFFGFDFEEV